jgi:PGF-CTERM protein
MTLPVTFVWMAPLVEKDTNKTVEATIGTASMSVNVTIRDEVPAIVISNFIANPATFRIGDVVVFKATVMNNGSGDAIGMTVNFLDGTTVLATSDPFNLTVGSSTQKSLNVTISGTADVNHTFYVKESTMGTTMNMSVLVGHRLAPASIGIATFTVKPTKKDKQPTDSEQSYTLTVSLKNFGEVASTNCTLTMKEGKKVLQTAAININGGAYWNQTYTWKVKGGGDHTAVATLTGADTGTPSSVTAKCTLEYTPGFEVLFLVAAILVAALLVRRRKN